MSERLSLSLGLRWEVNPAPGVTQGLKPYTIQGSSPNSVTLAPQGTPLWKTTWFNFAPRLGAAYVFVIAFLAGKQLCVAGVGFLRHRATVGVTGFQWAGVCRFGIISTRILSGGLSAIPPIVNPPLRHINDICTALPRICNCRIRFSGMPASSRHLASHRLLLFPMSVRTLEIAAGKSYFEPTDNPNASSFYFVENGLTSDYDSLQVQFRRRLSRGLTALASYTWSHCIDYGSQNYLRWVSAREL